MRRLLAFGLVAALAGGPALAQPQPKPAAPPRIFLSPSGEPFRQSPVTPDPLKAWFDHIDVNQDGVIDRFEFRADAVRYFKVLDENGDGVLDGFEAADYEHKLVPELAEQAEGRLPGQFGPRDRGGAQSEDRPSKPGQRGTEPHREGGLGGGPGRGGRGIAQLLDEPEPVTGADLRLDGHITLEEWLRATDQRFELLDTAKTGRLTLEALRAKMAELQRVQQQRQQQQLRRAGSAG